MSSGLIGMAMGMAMGMAVAGIAADRIGRRRVLAASMLLFGAATVAIGFAHDVLTIIALRFVAGLGIGGALAGLFAAEVLPVFGWRGLF